LRETAASLGLVFNPDREKFANTKMGHALLEFAKQDSDEGLQNRVSEVMFKVSCCLLKIGSI